MARIKFDPLKIAYEKMLREKYEIVIGCVCAACRDETPAPRLEDVLTPQEYFDMVDVKQRESDWEYEESELIAEAQREERWKDRRDE